MKNLRFHAVAIAVLALAGIVCAQGPCNPGAFETFDAATPGNPGTYPAGWTTDPASTWNWRVHTGSTTSFGTGPSGDHTTGSGNYMYCETSSPTTAGDTYILVPPCFDTTGVAAPAVDFWLHMYGATMGTFELQEWDGAAWVTTYTLSGDQGDIWMHVNVPMTYPGPSAQVRFKYTRGTSFTGDCAIDDVALGAPPPPPDYQENAPNGTVDIDGTVASAYLPAIVNKAVVNCPAGVSPATGTLHLATNVGAATYEIAYNSLPVVPLSAGGLPLPGGILNLNLAGGLMYINGGANLNFLSLPGAGFPGVTGADISIPFAITTALDMSLQGVFTDPASVAGYVLTQATEFHVASTTGASSVAGPTSDDNFVTVDVVNAPACWTNTGVPFYGTIYTEVTVCANGRVMFGGGDSDFTPSVTEALADNPFVGCWADISPNIAGSVTLSSPATDIVRVDYVNVPYFGEPTTSNTFFVEFDATSGIVTLGGLTGIAPQPGTASPGDDMFVGMSPGNSVATTDPGVTLFTQGGAGGVAAATDMLYDFYSATTATGLAPSLLPGSLNDILFVPSTAFPTNYDWAGL